jgi:hypothetical protein
MKAYLCGTCGETKPEAFKNGSKGLCYKCKKAVCRDYYHTHYSAQKTPTPESGICSVCGTTDPQRFLGHSATRCKECLSAPHQEWEKPPAPVKPTKEPRLGPFVCRRCGENRRFAFYSSCPTRCKSCNQIDRLKKKYPYYEDLILAQGGEYCSTCRRTPVTLGRKLSVDVPNMKLLCRQCLAKTDRKPARLMYLR